LRRRAPGYVTVLALPRSAVAVTPKGCGEARTSGGSSPRWSNVADDAPPALLALILAHLLPRHLHHRRHLHPPAVHLLLTIPTLRWGSAEGSKVFITVSVPQVTCSRLQSPV